MKKIKENIPLILNVLILLLPYGLIINWIYNYLVPVGPVNGFYISLSALIGLAFLTISLGIHIILHEFGHLITGLISGYKFGFFRIWKYALTLEDGKFKVKNFHIPGSLGQCLMEPPELIDGDFPYLLYNLGGVISNGIFALIGIIIILKNPHELINAFFLAFAFVGIYIAFTNAYPFEFLPNDGNNIKSMNRSEDSRKAFYNALLLTGLYMEENPNLVNVKKLVSKDSYQDYSEPLVQNILSENVSLYIVEGDLYKALEFSEFLLRQKNVTLILRNLILIDKISLHLLLGHKDDVERIKRDKNFAQYLKTKGQGEIERCKYIYYSLHEPDREKAGLALKTYKKISQDHLFSNHVNYDLILMNLANKKSKWLNKLNVLDNISSTNDYLKNQVVSGLCEYEYVLSYEQSAGKGQGDKSFFSPKGGMYLSVLIRPKYSTKELKYLTARAALAVSNSIEKALNKRVCIKWINDLVYKDKKVGGILTESKISTNGEIEYVILGVGLNLKMPKDLPGELEGVYGSLEEINVKKSANTILYYLIPELNKLVDEVDLDFFLPAYNKYLYRKNRFIKVESNGDIYETLLTGVNENMDLVTEMNGLVQAFSYHDSRIKNIY